MKIKYVFLLLCFALIVPVSIAVFHRQEESRFLRKIRKIPLEDRAALETFFRILILEEGGAYVLFGSKPMAFTAYFNNCASNIATSKRWRYYLENQNLKDGWKIWEKYQSLFPSDQFILECKSSDVSRDEICMISRRKFKQLLKDNLTDFQAVLGKEITPEGILNEYQNGEVALFNLLKEHHALLGILLGFGSSNSWKYYEYAARIGDPYSLQEIPFKIPSYLDENSEDTLFQTAFKEINHRKCFKYLYLPYFKADIASQETLELQAQYLHQRQEIQEKYSHDSFLEVTLKRFCLNR